MRSYLGVVTAAQEDERKRLARELHDQTIQDLIALRQRVQMARRKAGGDPAGMEARFAELQSMLETTMEEVRRFSRALRPMYLEEAGLVAALQALARDARQEGLQVSFQVEGKAQRLSPEIELALYRIIQAALQNTVRHSRASKVSVSIEYAQGVTIRVRDDGIGFVVPQRLSDLAEAGHYGLMGMQERAQLVGALLSVTSQPGSGTEIDVRWLPADSDHRIEA
jgi:signal transduction histidine kinase